LSFLNRISNGNKAYTKRVRYSQLSSFFNFVRNNIDPNSVNPCDTSMVRKLYRERVVSRWEIIEKETIDEIIFRTVKVRNRLILELMARGGMRIGEVLKLTMRDIQDRKLILREPKSGKEHEIVFIPQKVADRLRDYAILTCKSPEDRIFPISYEASKGVVVKSGKNSRPPVETARSAPAFGYICISFRCSDRNREQSDPQARQSFDDSTLSRQNQRR
jgi:integrase